MTKLTLGVVETMVIVMLADIVAGGEHSLEVQLEGKVHIGGGRVPTKIKVLTKGGETHTEETVLQGEADQGALTGGTEDMITEVSH